jgi:threonylcarbamoyladenosine tRNA methylthiotransferase MtaB
MTEHHHEITKTRKKTKTLDFHSVLFRDFVLSCFRDEIFSFWFRLCRVRFHSISPYGIPMKKSVALETLGCKVNQYESSYLMELLQAAGYEPVPFRQSADVYVVHSCAVTSKAAFQARQLLRRAQRLHPQATIVVAGCAAQIEPQRFVEAALATHILGSAEKYDLLRWLQTPATLAQPCCAVSDSRNCRSFRVTPVTHMAAARTRAFLKVQDGCDAFCSYCIVPYSRGASRSLALPEVREQFSRFTNAGYREVVLSGIHLGQWGKDLQPMNLANLLDSLHAYAAAPRLRLSSLETLEWRDGLIHNLTRWGGICPHFHIPLQSGDAEILRRMHRPYTPREFAEVIQELRHLYPLAALGCDVLAGFPGETERHFSNTLEFIKRLPLSYLHVFPYSPRPGTEAASWPGRATGGELKRRTKALRELGLRKRIEFHQQFLEKTVEVLVENQVRGQRGWYQGTTDNYLKVAFPAPILLTAGSSVRIKIHEASAAGLTGRWVGLPTGLT